MTQKAIPCILIVGFNAERAQHIFYIADDRIGLFILNLAAFNVNDIMRILLINACNDLSSACAVKRSLHLVAVMIRIVHLYDRLYLSVRFHQFADVRLFLFQLLLIGDSLIIAATTFLGIRTASVG